MAGLEGKQMERNAVLIAKLTASAENLGVQPLPLLAPSPWSGPRAKGRRLLMTGGRISHQE
jgi:hypothetical protein